MPIIIAPDLDEPTRPPCPHCSRPGNLLPSGLYFCSNKDCAAPDRPHHWYVL